MPWHCRKANRTLENLEAGDLKLSQADLAEVNAVLDSHEVKGDRHFGVSDQELNLWG
jgi:pyridoxine 4-dehydrogenase